MDSFPVDFLVSNKEQAHPSNAAAVLFSPLPGSLFYDSYPVAM